MMKPRVSLPVVVAVLVAAASFVVITAAPARVKLTPAQECVVAKEKATARKITAKIKCYRRTKLAPADPTCLQRAEDKFAKAFAKAEKPGACLDPGDADTVGLQVDALVNALLQALQPAARGGRATLAQEKCATAKFGAAGKYAAGVLSCGGVSTGTASCIQRGRDTLNTAFATAEAAGGCFTVGDAGKIEYLVDLNVEITLQMFLPPAATPTRTLTPPRTLVSNRTPTRTPTPGPRCGDGTCDTDENCTGSIVFPFCNSGCCCLDCGCGTCAIGSCRPGSQPPNGQCQILGAAVQP